MHAHDEADPRFRTGGPPAGEPRVAGRPARPATRPPGDPLARRFAENGYPASMASPVARPGHRQGTFLLADISGYTGFLNGVAEAHRSLIVEADEPPPAYALLSTLLDAMVDRVEPRFRLVKLEGDAMFAVADEDAASMRGEAVLDCLRACYAAFRDLLGSARSVWSCTCDACARIHDLGLKFVLHHGGYVVQRIVGREELAGLDVIVAHRLLKNHARDLVGDAPYALLSDAAMSALAVPEAGMLATVETYDDLPPIPVHVLRLEA